MKELGGWARGKQNDVDYDYGDDLDGYMAAAERMARGWARNQPR